VGPLNATGSRQRRGGLRRGVRLTHGFQRAAPWPDTAHPLLRRALAAGRLKAALAERAAVGAEERILRDLCGELSEKGIYETFRCVAAAGLERSLPGCTGAEAGPPPRWPGSSAAPGQGSGRGHLCRHLALSPMPPRTPPPPPP
jgi:hypothetical protein